MDNSSFGTPQPPSCATSSEALHDLSLAWITYIAISINITLCITAAFGNIVILVALQVDCHRLHSPSKLLFRSLASTDLAVGLISQPCFVMHLILIVRKRLSSCHITEGVVQISGAILCGISIFTLTAMSVDRLLALLLGLRYRQIVTLARVRGIIVTSWLVFPSFAMLFFWNIHIFTITLCVNVLLCLAASTSCYMKIYFTLRYRQTRISQQSRPGQINNSTRAHLAAYNKTVSNSLWIFFTLIASYLPFAIVRKNWNCARSEPVHCYRRRKHNFSGLSEFFPEPSYLLLEDKRSETSNKHDGKAFLLFLFLVTQWTRTNNMLNPLRTLGSGFKPGPHW